jgi:TolB-like protein
MSDVFVSYKAEDKRRVKLLVEALEADGYSVWWDEQIGGGAAWRQSIEAELNAAQCVVVAWSKRSVGPSGAFVQDEATRAQQRQVYVPLLIDKVHLPLGFGETQALPLVGWRGDRSDPRYQAVLSAVRRLAGGAAKPGAVARPSEHGGVSRRTMVAGGAVAAVAIAGAGGWALLRGTADQSGSIAVLPFANLSGDPSQKWFSDGIAEELRSALGRIAGLKVVGRTSSEAVRDDDAETAAKKLGVVNILTGSVRQSPSKIRVSAQLIDGSDGVERWSENYDRTPGDAINIQTDIAENVAGALSFALGSAARAIAVGGTKNPEAQRLLLQAIAVVDPREREALKQAISLADAAIEMDPNYADAFAHKALFQNLYAAVWASSAAELAEYRAKSMQSAKAAIRLAPNFSTAHRALAEVHRVALNIRSAEEQFRRALELAPGDAGTVRDYALFTARLGRSTEAVNLSQRALTLDPLNAASYFARFLALVSARQYSESVSFSKELERSRPHLFGWPEQVAYSLILQNKFNEAAAYLERAPADNYDRLVNEAALLSRTGGAHKVPEIIDSLRQLYGESASYQIAQIYAQLNDADRAFAALRRGWEIKDAGLLKLQSDRYMDPLRADPRFSQLLRLMNFLS